MRIARVTDASGRTTIARLENDLAVPLLDAPEGFMADALRDALARGSLADLASAAAIADPLALSAVTLRAPITAPQKIPAIGLNYADHARESGMEPPKAPVMFTKFPNSIIGPGEPITYRRADSVEVDYEVELAAIIGRRARDVTESDALDYLAGYTICNDVSARDAQFSDGQWVRGKSFDTFCPLGPWVVSADEVPDPQALGIRCTVNGVALQDSTTKEMIFSVAELVSYLSRFMTLEPGDVIATGTPFGVGFARTPPVYLVDGDVVECSIDGLGTLSNPVIAT